MACVISRPAPRLGFLTVPLHFKQRMEGLEGLRDAVNFAAAHRYNAVQVAMFPTVGADGTVRDFAAETLQAQFAMREEGYVRGEATLIERNSGVMIDSVAFCANILGNAADRAHLEDVIRAGGIIGARSVVTFIGNANSLLKEAGIPFQGPKARDFFLKQVAATFNPLVEMARERDMELQIENCPMAFAMDPNGLTGITNLFSSPALIIDVLNAVPNLKLHFDPSHVRNYLIAGGAATETITTWITQFGDVMGSSCHIKDGEDAPQRSVHLSLGDPFDANTHTQGLWIARAPGRGAIDWTDFERTMDIVAPHCDARIVELEDVSAEGRKANEALFISTAHFYRHIFKTVYGAEG